MAGLFSDPQQLIQFLAQPGAGLPGAGPVQAPANQGAVQALLQNPKLLQAIKAITGANGSPLQQLRPADMVQALKQGTAPISNAVHPFEAAMQSVDSLVGKYGDIPQRVKTAAQQLALPQSRQQLALGMGQLGPQTMANTAIPMGPGAPKPAIPLGPGVIQQAKGAAQQLGNGARAIGGQAMNMARGAIGSVKEGQLSQLAQKAQASGQLLPALRNATLAGIPLPAALSNPAIGTALGLTALFGGAIGAGAYTGQKLRNWRDNAVAEQDEINYQRQLQQAGLQGQFDELIRQNIGEVQPPQYRSTPAFKSVAPGEDVTTPVETVTANPRPVRSPGIVAPSVSAELPPEAMAPEMPPAPPASEALPVDPSTMPDSANTYGYESILDDPAYGLENTLRGLEPVPMPGQEKGGLGGFFSGLGDVLKGIAPNIVEALMMNQLDKPQGGVKDWITGLTFGASDPTQSLAYQSFVADKNERAARRQKEFEMGLTLENEMVKKQMDAQIAMDKAAYDFEINTVKNAQGVAMELLKENKINWSALQQLPNFDEIVNGLTSSNPEEVYPAIQAILATNPDVENQLKQQGYAAFQALSEITDPKEREAFMNDPQIQGVLSAVGMGPTLADIYKQEKMDERTNATLQQQAALTYFREGRADVRNQRSTGSAAASRSLARERFEYEKKKYEYEMTHGKPYTQKAPGAAASTTSASAPKLKTVTFPQGKVTGMFDKNGVPTGEIMFEPTIMGKSVGEDPIYTDIDGLIEMGVIPGIQTAPQPQPLPVTPASSPTGSVLKIITDPSQLGG